MRPAARIAAYFDACNTGDAAAVAAHFTESAVVYDTNVRPARGRRQIGEMWAAVSVRWGGAQWSVDSLVESVDGATAAIEWSMTGSDPRSGRQFVFRGSEHYRFEGSLIAEIRQYWTFDRDRLDTGLIDYDSDSDSDSRCDSEGDPPAGGTSDPCLRGDLHRS